MAKQYSGTFQFTDGTGAAVGTAIIGAQAANVNQAYRLYLQGQGPRGIVLTADDGKLTYVNFEAPCYCGATWTPTVTEVEDPDCDEPAC